MAPVVEVDDQIFGKLVLEVLVPVLVDFRADWCAPCRALEPALADIAGGGSARSASADWTRTRTP